EELFRSCGLPADALADTLRRYNAGAGVGDDPQCGKNAEWLRPLRPPFGAYPTGAGGPETFNGLPLKPQGFTLGGLHTDTDSRVLDRAGAPLRRGRRTGVTGERSTVPGSVPARRERPVVDRGPLDPARGPGTPVDRIDDDEGVFALVEQLRRIRALTTGGVFDTDLGPLT